MIEIVCPKISSYLSSWLSIKLEYFACLYDLTKFDTQSIDCVPLD